MRGWYKWSSGSVKLLQRGEELDAGDRRRGGELQRDEVRGRYRSATMLRACEKRLCEGDGHADADRDQIFSSQFHSMLTLILFPVNLR